MVLSTTTCEGTVNSLGTPWKLRVTLVILLIVFIYVIILREKKSKYKENYKN